MVSPPPGVAANTRRSLLGGAAAGAVVLVVGCGTHVQKPPMQTTPAAPGDADVAIFNRVLELEYRAIAAYTAGIPLLDGSAQDAAKQFLEQELYHASKLYSMIKTAGGTPDKVKNYALGRPRTHEQVLRLLLALEHAQVAGYLAAVPVVSHGSARSVLAAILANDAQHDVVLRAELGLEPLTGALVGGGGRQSAQ